MSRASGTIAVQRSLEELPDDVLGQICEDADARKAILAGGAGGVSKSMTRIAMGSVRRIRLTWNDSGSATTTTNAVHGYRRAFAVLTDPLYAGLWTSRADRCLSLEVRFLHDTRKDASQVQTSTPLELFALRQHCITALDLCDSDIRYGGLSTVIEAGFPHLSELNLSGATVRGRLPFLPTLRHLNLKGCAFPVSSTTWPDQLGLSRLTDLRTLNVSFVKYVNDDPPFRWNYDFARGMVHLEELVCGSCYHDAVKPDAPLDFSCWSGLTRLRRLELTHDLWIDDTALSSLPDLPSLVSLEIVEANAYSIRHICHLSQLTELLWIECDLSGSGGTPLPSLRDLYAYSDIGPGLELFPGLTRLTGLRIPNLADLRFVVPLRQLRVLEFNGIDDYDAGTDDIGFAEGLAHLRSMTQLQQLRLMEDVPLEGRNVQIAELIRSSTNAALLLGYDDLL